ncbi:hypothetical protein [Burkholderia vietnamiensis]|nr:hypothetical protein [Burkholderia vietnamiensis]
MTKAQEIFAQKGIDLVLYRELRAEGWAAQAAIFYARRAGRWLA